MESTAFVGAFILSCTNGNLEMVKLLVDSVEKCSYAVDCACKNGRIEVLKFLHSRGYDITKRSNVLLACQGGFFDIVEYLVDNGVEHCLEGIASATSYGHFEIAKYLIAQYSMRYGLTGISYNISCALVHAVRQKNFEMTRYLIEHGADISFLDFKCIRITLRTRACQPSCQPNSARRCFSSPSFLFSKTNTQRDRCEYIREKNDDFLGRILSLLNYELRISTCIATINICVESGHVKTLDFLTEYVPKNFLFDSTNLDWNEKKIFLQRYSNLRSKIRTRAANKIGSWWIPICYDLKRESGQRMMEKGWEKIQSYD